MRGYDGLEMGLDNPLDRGIRARLREAGVNQNDMARAIGRGQSWLNKYMHGAGHATVDDVVRMLAVLIGVEVQPLSEMERRLLKAWRQIGQDRQEDAVIVLENVAKSYRRMQPEESDAPRARTTPATARRAHGRRTAAGG